jgi:hypothetical protein
LQAFRDFHLTRVTWYQFDYPALDYGYCPKPP